MFLVPASAKRVIPLFCLLEAGYSLFLILLWGPNMKKGQRRRHLKHALWPAGPYCYCIWVQPEPYKAPKLAWRPGRNSVPTFVLEILPEYSKSKLTPLCLGSFPFPFCPGFSWYCALKVQDDEGETHQVHKPRPSNQIFPGNKKLFIPARS